MDTMNTDAAIKPGSQQNNLTIKSAKELSFLESAKELSFLEQNNIKLDVKHTVLTPQYLENLIKNETQSDSK